MTLSALNKRYQLKFSPIISDLYYQISKSGYTVQYKS